MLGGSTTLEYGDTSGLRFHLNLSRGWRSPSLDELYARWGQLSPPHRIDAIPVPDTLVAYQGNPRLDPVLNDYGGIGFRYTSEDRIRFSSSFGYRSYHKRIGVREMQPGEWTRKMEDGNSGLEWTNQGSAVIYGPFTLSGAFSLTTLDQDSLPIPDYFGWGTISYANQFYSGNLHLYSAITLRHYGPYLYKNLEHPADTFLEGILSARISSFEIYWGTRNLFNRTYQFLPGFTSMHRDEIWGVRWILWD